MFCRVSIICTVQKWLWHPLSWHFSVFLLAQSSMHKLPKIQVRRWLPNSLEGWVAKLERDGWLLSLSKDWDLLLCIKSVYCGPKLFTGSTAPTSRLSFRSSHHFMPHHTIYMVSGLRAPPYPEPIYYRWSFWSKWQDDAQFAAEKYSCSSEISRTAKMKLRIRI
jgi:hypothetical protein